MTCLFNIIFYVESKDAKEQSEQFLASVQKRFPCRSIFIVEGSEEQCTLGPSNACGQTTILCTEASREKVPFLIFSSLIADLPIYVIWAQDPCNNNPVLDVLKAIATKIVFDPAAAVHIKSYASYLLQHIELAKCGLTDLAWFHSLGWRELFAEIFHSQALIDELFHARTLRIHYSACQGGLAHRAELPALYLQGWVAAQLNWKVKDLETIEGNIRICYERFSHDTVVLLSADAPGATSAITSIEVESDTAHFLCKKLPKSSSVKVWISSKESCEIPFTLPLSEPSKEMLVINELFTRGTSLHYHNMLKLLYQMQWNEEK